MRFGCSRSSKVVDFGTNRKGVCDFLLVINSNFGPSLHRFWDTASYCSYWLKIANFSYPTLVWRPRSGGTRQNFRMKLSVQKLEGWGYCRWKLHDPNFNRFWLIHPCDRRRDGRTDRRTDRRTEGIAIAYARLAYMLSRAIKRLWKLSTSLFFLWIRLALIFFCHICVKIALPVSVLSFSAPADLYLRFRYLHFPPL